MPVRETAQVERHHQLVQHQQTLEDLPTKATTSTKPRWTTTPPHDSAKEVSGRTTPPVIQPAQSQSDLSVGSAVELQSSSGTSHNDSFKTQQGKYITTHADSAMEIDAPEPVSPVALLLCLAQQVQLEASEILHLCCYPPDILATALDAAPILAASIRAQLGTTAQLSPTDVQNAYAHRVMLALTLLETAWYQKEESLSEKQRISIGCEVGKVGIEVLQGILWQQDEDAKAKRLKDAMTIGRHTLLTEGVSPPRETRSGVKRKMSEEVNAVSSSGKKRSRKPQDAAEDVKQLKNLHDSAKSIRMTRRTSSMRLDFPENVDATDVKPVRPKTQNVTWERARIAAQEERDRDCRAILFRVEEVVSRSLIIAQTLCNGIRIEAPSAAETRNQMWELTMMQATLSYLQAKLSSATKQIKQAISAARDDPAQSVALYRMMLLLAGWQSEGTTSDVTASFATLRDLAAIAKARKHLKVVTIAYLARARMAMAMSYFDVLETALSEAADALGIDASWYSVPSATSSSNRQLPGEPEEPNLKPLQLEELSSFDASMISQYLLLRITWETRRGGGKIVTKLLKELHQVLDKGAMDNLTSTAGLLQIKLPAATDGSASITGNLHVQGTSPNTFVASAYLVSCIAKADPVGKNPRRARYGKAALQSLETYARHGCWDVGFELGGGLSRARAVHDEIAGIKADVLLDQANLAVCRSDFVLADQLLDRLLDHLQTSHLFTSFAPKTLLLHAQRAQMLGRSSSAEAAYAACRYVCNAGSEMELLSRLNIFCLELARCSAADLPRMRQDAQSLIEEVSSFVLVYFDVAASVLTAVTEERISIAKQQVTKGIAKCLDAELRQPKAVLLALGAMEFFATDPEACIKMLRATLEDVRLLGNRAEDDTEQLGHAKMGAWIGKKLEDLYRRKGDRQQLKRQLELNNAHNDLVEYQTRFN